MVLGPLEFLRGKTAQAQVERRLLLGGMTGALVRAVHVVGQEGVIPNYPPELKQRLDPHLPPNGEILTLVAPPVVTQVAKMVARSTDTKEKLSDIGFGTILYSVPRLVQRIGSETAYQIGLAERPPAAVIPTVTTKYALTATAVNARATSTTVAPTRGLSKYVLTA